MIDKQKHTPGPEDGPSVSDKWFEYRQERDRLREINKELLGATRKAIASGPMKIEPTPETFESVEALPDNTMIDFRISVATYKAIKTAIAKAEKS